MMGSKVFADNFSRSFSESGDFFQFLSARQARSKWMTAPSKELRFEPVERGSTLGNLYMQIYDHNGDADVLEDTMENTSLLLKVDGKDYPVRSCALKTVLERARISGHALNKVSKSVFAEILNYCMGVASGDSLIKVADEKVSAVHGGDPKDYTVMEMLPLFKATNDFLNREYPGNRFMTAHFDHSIATAIWCLDGQADKLLDTYHREIAAKGLRADKLFPHCVSPPPMSACVERTSIRSSWPAQSPGLSHWDIPSAPSTRTDLAWSTSRSSLVWSMRSSRKQSISRFSS